jgi:hypothetical protein
MSLYQFIACESELPELFRNKKSCSNSFEDFSDLEIVCPVNEYYDDIPYYTNKKHIYSLDWQYSEENCKKLWQYLREIPNDSLEIELWSISLCDYYRLGEEILYRLENSKRVYCPMNQLSIDILKAAVTGGVYPNVLIIRE